MGTILVLHWALFLFCTGHYFCFALGTIFVLHWALFLFCTGQYFCFVHRETRRRLDWMGLFPVTGFISCNRLVWPIPPDRSSMIHCSYHRLSSCPVCQDRAVTDNRNSSIQTHHQLSLSSSGKIFSAFIIIIRQNFLSFHYHLDSCDNYFQRQSISVRKSYNTLRVL